MREREGRVLQGCDCVFILYLLYIYNTLCDNVLMTTFADDSAVPEADKNIDNYAHNYKI